MESVIVSSKYQVVIPNSICKSIGLLPGQIVQMFLYGNHIEIIPIKPIKSARGFLKGIDTKINRENDRI
jgi:AbrB family looped-hinge helix DNA binding protein